MYMSADSTALDDEPIIAYNDIIPLEGTNHSGIHFLIPDHRRPSQTYGFPSVLVAKW